MEAVFLKLLNMSIAASWLVLVVVVLRMVLKKAPKAIRCFLWALVAFRLICPFSFESVLSLIPSAETVPENIMYVQEPVLYTGIPVINNMVNPVLSETFTQPVEESVNPMQLVTFLSSIVWVAGLIAMTIYAVYSYSRIHRKVAASVHLKDNLYLCDYIDTPFILGIVKPRIYLPSTLKTEQTVYVVAHEKAHLKRRDHWWKPLGFTLLSIYWFNPLIWLAYILLCRDIELACDERVIQELGESEKKSYSETLLLCSIPRKMIVACPVAFGEVGVKERVRTVLHYKKPAFRIMVVAVIACIVVAVCFLTNPKEEKEEAEKQQILEQPISEPDLQQNEEPQIYVEGTIFHYKGTDFDITERNSLVYNVREYIELDSYILVVGSIGKNAEYYGVFNTATQTFERDIEASRLIYRNNDIRTMVYFFEKEIFDYDGNVIRTCELEESEYIYDISFAEDGTKLKIEIGRVNSDAPPRVEMMSLPDDLTDIVLPGAEALTMEKLIELCESGRTGLAQDMSSFVRGDGLPYSNFVKNAPLTDSTLCWNYFCTLPYEGEEYELRVYYVKAGIAEQYGYNDDELFAIELIHLNSSDIKLLYRIDKEITDLDIQTFLDNEYDISAHLTLELPGNIQLGAYDMNMNDIWQGSLFVGNYEEIPHGQNCMEAWYAPGGVGLVKSGDIVNSPNGGAYFENGKLQGFTWDYMNHAWRESEFEAVEGCDMQAVICEYDFELFTAPESQEYWETNGLTEEEFWQISISRYWYVFFAEPNSEYQYTLFLNQQYFSREDAIAMAKTVKFTR